MAEKNNTVIIKNELLETYERLNNLDEAKKTKEIKDAEKELAKIISEMDSLDDKIFQREIKERKLDLIIKRYSRKPYVIERLKPEKKELNLTLREKISNFMPLIFLLFAVILLLLMAIREMIWYVN